MLEGYDYIQYVRKPFAIVNRAGNKAVDQFARPWFNKIASDPRCARCFCKVAGLLFFQKGPVHYGCLVKSEEYYEHADSHARALRGSLYVAGWVSHKRRKIIRSAPSIPMTSVTPRASTPLTPSTLTPFMSVTPSTLTPYSLQSPRTPQTPQSPRTPQTLPPSPRMLPESSM